MSDRIDEIRARAEAYEVARDAMTAMRAEDSASEDTSPCFDRAYDDALDVERDAAADSAQDIPYLLAEIDRLRAREDAIAPPLCGISLESPMSDWTREERRRLRRTAASKTPEHINPLRTLARLALAQADGTGVRLSADEVYDLINGDSAVQTAIQNIAYGYYDDQETSDV